MNCFNYYHCTHIQQENISDHFIYINPKSPYSNVWHHFISTLPNSLTQDSNWVLDQKPGKFPKNQEHLKQVQHTHNMQ